MKLEVGMRVKDGTAGELGTCTGYDSSTNTYCVVGDDTGPGWYTEDGRNFSYPEDDRMAVYPIAD